VLSSSLSPKRRTISGATWPASGTRQAQGRLKRLERFKRDEALDRPRQESTIALRLQTPLRSGDKVVWSQDLVVGYESRCAALPLP